MPALGATARVILPVVVAGVVHSVVIARDLLTWLKKPLDFGARIRGEPLFGANKTFRGPLVMTIASAASAAMLSLVWRSNCYPAGFTFLAKPGAAFRFGLWTGMGYSLAELPNSFVKRRMHIPPGEHPRGLGKILSYLVDQVDSVAGIVLLLGIVYSPPRRVLASIFVMGSLVHIAIDLLLYVFGVKKLNSQGSPAGGASQKYETQARQKAAAYR